MTDLPVGPIVNSMDIIESVEALAAPVAYDLALELLEVEFQREHGGWVLRLYIDKDGGVNLNDCQKMSRELGFILDVKDAIDVSYNLEVSSPGLDRPLTREKDFVRYIGEMVRIKVEEAIDGRKNFSGRLKGIEDGKVIVAGSEECEWQIEMANIKKARLDVAIGTH
ncbi:MAG: ribosome maturation factor RimP [Thermodesulfobacteriota bacterium]